MRIPLELVVLMVTLLLVLGPANGVELQSLAQVTGQVGAGNFSYIGLKQTVPLKLVLTSISGDADLYVSDVEENPTYHLEHHVWSSWSPGLDFILIPDIKTPPSKIYIGIYGYPKFSESHYVLEVFALRDMSYKSVAERSASASSADYSFHTKRADEAHVKEEQTEDLPLWMSVLLFILEALF